MNLSPKYLETNFRNSLMRPPAGGQPVQTCDDTLTTRPYMMNFEEVANENWHVIR
jgi:hypothetical protein